MGCCASTPKQGIESLPHALCGHFCGTVCCATPSPPCSTRPCTCIMYYGCCCVLCNQCRCCCMKESWVPLDSSSLTTPTLTRMLREGGTVGPSGMKSAKVMSFSAKPIGAGEGFFSDMLLLDIEYEDRTVSTDDSATGRSLLNSMEKAGTSSFNSSILDDPLLVEEHRLPRKLVAKEQLVGRSLALFRSEVNLYRHQAQLLDAANVLAPTCRYAYYDRTFGRFVLLMDAVHTPSESQIIGASPAQAGLAMETLARFHALNWNQCRARGLDELFLARDDPKFLTFAHAKVFVPGVAGLPELCRHLNVAYPPEARHVLENAISHFGRYIELFGTPKEAGGQYNCTLIHGDYRLDNMFFEAGRMSEVATNELERKGSFRGSVGEAGSMKLIDFQCVKESNGEVDLAYFLSQSLDVKMRREHECEMIRLYHETLMNHRVNADEYSLVECVHLFQVHHFVSSSAILAAARSPETLVGDSTAAIRGRELCGTMCNRLFTSLTDWNCAAAFNACMATPTGKLSEAEMLALVPANKKTELGLGL